MPDYTTVKSQVMVFEDDKRVIMTFVIMIAHIGILALPWLHGQCDIWFGSEIEGSGVDI